MWQSAINLKNRLFKSRISKNVSLHLTPQNDPKMFMNWYNRISKQKQHNWLTTWP